jgi:hypothetical protein
MADEGDIRFILGRLEGKVDALISQTATLGRSISNHENRIQELEKSKSWVLGVSAACSGGIAFLFHLMN